MNFVVLFAFRKIRSNLYQRNPWNVQSKDPGYLPGDDFSGERLKALGRASKFDNINMPILCFY